MTIGAQLFVAADGFVPRHERKPQVIANGVPINRDGLKQSAQPIYRGWVTVGSCGGGLTWRTLRFSLSVFAVKNKPQRGGGKAQSTQDIRKYG